MLCVPTALLGAKRRRLFAAPLSDADADATTFIRSRMSSKGLLMARAKPLGHDLDMSARLDAIQVRDEHDSMLMVGGACYTIHPHANPPYI